MRLQHASQSVPSGKKSRWNQTAHSSSGIGDHLWRRFASLTDTRTVRSGDLKVSVSFHPLSIRIENKDGRFVNELAIDDVSTDLSFSIAGGLLLGLGQGGPQFDRRGYADSMVSGQGGYHLGTHGARVPVQFLIGTAGWGLFVHAPLGTFDLSGEKGLLRAFRREAALPMDVFVIGANQPV